MSPALNGRARLAGASFLLLPLWQQRVSQFKYGCSYVEKCMRTRSGAQAAAAMSTPGNAHLDAQIAALQTQVASLQAQVANAGPVADIAPVPNAQPRVHPLTAVANVPVLDSFSDINKLQNNPVQRGHHAPPTISLLDLSLEAGMMRASAAGPAIKREYEVIAAVLSYLWDIKAAFEQQCSADDVPETRRKSLSVPVSALGEVVDFLHARRDLLVTKGEFKNDPCLVKAVEMGLNGTDGLPITNSRVHDLLEKATASQVVYLQKQSAKQAAVGTSRDS